jgi:hypothetical protein
LDVPLFAATDMLGAENNYFANSLTLTLHDFVNYFHVDRDFAPFVYGMWWVGTLKDGRWHLDLQHGHDKI